jgi:hypothetical protein
VAIQTPGKTTHILDRHASLAMTSAMRPSRNDDPLGISFMLTHTHEPQHLAR